MKIAVKHNADRKPLIVVKSLKQVRIVDNDDERFHSVEDNHTTLSR